MTTNQYTPSWKQWDHTGNIVSEIEHSVSHRPPLELKPAAWLPVGSNYDKKTENYRVVAAGKVIALDREGRAVPAGMRKAFEVAGGSVALTYTATDVTEKVTDLATGVAVAAATTYTQTALTAALQARGLIRATEYAVDFISRPIGYAPYSFLKWCGGDGFDPTQYISHNHNMQSGVSVGTDYCLILPMVPASVATEQMGSTTMSSSAITFGTSNWFSSTGIHATTRYADLVAAGDNVVAYVFAKYPVAKITLNTAITDSFSSLASMTEVDSIDAVITQGSSYFYIDYEAGVLFLYESGGNGAPTGFAINNPSYTITYYSYEDSATGSANYAQVIGDLEPGDFVSYDSNSNYIKHVIDIGTASGGSSGDNYSSDPNYAGTAATISAQLEATIEEALSDRVGQVVAIWTWPRSGLDKVMSQYTGLTSVERMPGTATKGMSDALNMASGANKMAIINFTK